MKRIIVYLFLLWIILCARIPLCAQVVDICAGDGTDSVTLSLNNYQYGLIQWQNSSDGVLWLDIEDANDTILRFLPVEDGYYRAFITYMDCPYDSSQVSHIKITPKANAGPDKLVNAGYMTQLRGNELEGVRSMWEVLEGDNAIIDDIEDPYSLFSGTDTLYQLQWTLANECGVSHDTVTIRYVEPIFYDKIVVVDTTDQIFGDSLERYLGIYRVAFSDPVPVITDSTILVGIPCGGFLRKVLYAEHRDDTVVMYTQQATMDDIIVRGAFSFDALASNNRHRDRGLYVRMDHLPTRAELQQNQFARDGRIPYYEFPSETPNWATASSVQSRGWSLGLTPFSGDHFDINANIKLKDIQFGLFDPFFDYTVQKSESGMVTTFYVGVENTSSFKLKIEGAFSINALEIPIIPDVSYRTVVMLGVIPVEVCATYSFKAKVKGSASVTSKSFDCVGRVSTALAFDADVDNGTVHTRFEPPKRSFHLTPEEGSSMNDVSVDLSLSLEHKVDLKLYEILGPFVSISTPKVSVGMCHTVHNNDNIHYYHLKGEIPWKIGLKGTILKKNIFDIHYGDSWQVFNWNRPGKVERYLDNSYNFHNFQTNDIVPIKVKVTGQVANQLSETPLALHPAAQLYESSLEEDVNSIVMAPVPGAKVLFSTNNGTLGHIVNVADPNGGYSGLDFTAEPVEAYADNNGIATVYWKPNNPTFNVIKAQVTDCSGEDIEGSPLMITVDNCGDSDLHLDIVDGQLRPSGGLGGGYMYGTSISGIMPFEWNAYEPLTLTPGNTYFVKSGSCVASAVCPIEVCRLSVTHSLQGNRLVVTARNGKGPYKFYLNNEYLNTSVLPSTMIPLPGDGTYSIKVVDAKGCEAVDENIVFWNQKTVPVVYTNRAYNTANEVYDDVQGIILSDGNCNITERGIYWSASANMASATKIISSSNSDNFVCHIPNVQQGQVLYACAYAVNEKGSGYGDTIALQQTDPTGPDQPSADAHSCPGTPTVTDIDGNTYNTVQIGQQCWMRENMKTTRYSDGTSIPLGNAVSYDVAYRYCPDDNSSNVDLYGYLYNWKAVMRNSFSSSSNPSGVQGICPQGWHVPSDAEWTQLTDYVSSQSEYVCGNASSSIAKALASTTGWNISSTTCEVGNTQSNNNATGFSAVPAGYYHGRYNYFGYNANFWSATQYNSLTAYYRYLYSDCAYVGRDDYDKNNGFSVRCLRDENTTSEVLPNSCPGTPTVTDIDGNTYNTVQIGQQCWMRENMKTTRYSDGTSIPLGNAVSYDVAYRYCPDDNSSNVDLYGYLYNWPAVMRNSSSSSSNPSGVQGICPTGWHVPSDAEWTQLTDYVSSQSEYVCGSTNTDIAKALASTTGWNSDSGTCCVGNTPSTNNATGFSAVPAGIYNSYGIDIGGSAHFWSATQSFSNYAYTRYLSYGNANVGSNNGSTKKYGSSVRCLRDENTTSEVLPNSCPGTPTVTDIDGNTYNTVQIGQQCWMRENMKTTRYSDGTSIPLGNATSYDVAYRYCPDDNSSNVDLYGYLYNWKAVMRNSSSSSSNPSGVQGICPTGWHVPSDAEWTQLTDYVSSQSQYVCGSNSTYIAKALASTTGWNSYGGTCCVGNTPANNNATGFSAVPAGDYNGSYYRFGGDALLWSATQYYSSSAYSRILNYTYANVRRDTYGKDFGLSVRCLRD